MHINAATAARLLPMIGVVAQHGHKHAEHHHHKKHVQGPEYGCATITKVVTVTAGLDSGQISASNPPVTSTVTSTVELTVTSTVTRKHHKIETSSAVSSSAHAAGTSAASSSAVLPSMSPPVNSSASFKVLTSVGGSATLKNSCKYPVYVLSAGNESCGADKGVQLLAAGSDYTEELRTCKNGGISLKVAKTKDMVKPMQFEYTVWEDGKIVSYDISYLDCMENENGQKDLSKCAGHNGGIQAVGGVSGQDDYPNYTCEANQWCDKQAYVVAEFDYKPNAPVGACPVEKGIAFELCACNR